MSIAVNTAISLPLIIPRSRKDGMSDKATPTEFNNKSWEVFIKVDRKFLHPYDRIKIQKRTKRLLKIQSL